MLLIRELTEETEILVEDVGGEKQYFIEGIYMQADKPNRNGRLYPKKVMEAALEKYRPLVEAKRAIGELGHPPTPQVNLHLGSHLIQELKFVGNDIYGKAKILDTPNGKIAKAYIKEGVKLGVSSRGTGSIKTVNGLNHVNEDFKLATVDIVADPSAPDAFVNGIMENAEWLYDESRGWICERLEEQKKAIHRMSSRELEAKKLKMFEEFLQNISKTI